MDFQTIRHDVNDGILTITLNRPEHLNAFTVTMAEELEHSFRAVNDDDSVRAVIVTGAGRAFCSGMDLSREGNVFRLDEQRTPGLSDMADLDDPAIAAVRDTGGRCTLAIHDCRKPVIAALNGAAVGIGATMTLAMDRRLMSTSARIGLVFGRIGIVPEACSTWYLPRLVGPSAALDLVLRADILGAEAALAVGLVDENPPRRGPADPGRLGRRRLDPGPLPRRRGPEPANGTTQRHLDAPRPGPPNRLTRHVLDQHRRRQGRRRRLPRETQTRLPRVRLRDAAVLQRLDRRPDLCFSACAPEVMRSRPLEGEIRSASL